MTFGIEARENKMKHVVCNFIKPSKTILNKTLNTGLCDTEHISIIHSE